jgi:1-acyl-sn-glycerol-3-phosphate acyltransferase
VGRFFSKLALFMFHIGFARPMLRWVVGARYRRRNLIPKGPCLVVSNHNSHLDAAVLMGMFPLRRLPSVHPVAAADYFGKTWFKRTLAMMLMNAIPIERRAAPGVDPLADIVRAIEVGDSLILFPEGSRGEAGVVTKFRAGIGLMVQQIPGLLVVPVYLSGPERIWPRGQTVPVPLNIDAIVGKPRTYPALDNPRQIADLVQRDVLALAPPPPPLPGPRPAPPLRVGICGIDPESRKKVFMRVAGRLGESLRTIAVSDRIFEIDGEGMKEMTRPVPAAPGRAWTGLLARIFRAGGMFTGEKFSRMVEQAQINEALGVKSATRFVVTDGSALVDLLAWAEADFYHGVFNEAGLNHLMQYLAGEKKITIGRWWNFMRKAPEVWLVNVFNLARPPVPDVVVQVTMPIPQAMAGLRSRGEELGPHENEAVMEKLQEGYRQVGNVLKKRRKTEVIECDASKLSAGEIAAQVEAVCRKLVEAE